MGSTADHGRDYLSENGAAALARKVEAVWASRWFPMVRAAIKEIYVPKKFGSARNPTVFSVETNLIDGLPPGVSAHALLSVKRAVERRRT